MSIPWFALSVIEAGRASDPIAAALAGELGLFGVPTEQSLFANDPPDEHAILTTRSSFVAYGGRAVVSVSKSPLIHMLPSPNSRPRIALLTWFCTCSAEFSRQVTVNPDTFNMVRIICDEFDHHVGR